MVVMFSKFWPGQRDSQLLLDSDNFTYSRKKDKDTPSTLPGVALRTGPSSVTSWSILIPTTLSARVLNHITMPPTTSLRRSLPSLAL